MAFKFDRVKEGDLITARLMNDILTALENLDVRIGTSTSAPGFLNILSVSPQPAIMGQNLTVLGENFGKPQDNIIIVGDAVVDAGTIDTAHSNNTALIFKFPSVDMPEDGWVWVTIANPTFLGIARKKIQISKPAVETTGTIEAHITVQLRTGSQPGVYGKQARKIDSSGVILPGQRSAPVTGSELSEISRKVSVIAKDPRGTVHTLKFVDYQLGKDHQDPQAAAITFVSGKLTPGKYRVTAKLAGFKTTSGDVTVIAGRKTAISLTTTQDTQGGVSPSKPIPGDGTWIKPNWYRTIDPVYRYTRWPWPPPEELVDLERVVDPIPDEVVQWQEEWAAWVQHEYPEAAVDPGNVQIYIEATYAPGDIADRAYAYMVFGEAGAYVPILLTTNEQASVPLGKSGLAGIDSMAANQLAAFGLENVAQLASSWKGLLVDAMNNTSPAAAQSTIQAAQAQSRSLLGSLLAVSGVDAEVEKKLGEMNIDSTVALANQESRELAEQLGDEAFAARLVAEARQKVPESEWSLTQLDLTESQISALEIKGITSLQSFKSEASSNPEVMAALLGAGREQVVAVANSIVVMKQKDYQQVMLRSAPVTNILGISREVGLALADMGLSNAGALANASANQIAGAFRGNKALAEAAINEAKRKVQIA